MSPSSKEIQIRWLPDGTCSGQSFGVGERGGVTHWVKVDALTGEISELTQEFRIGAVRNENAEIQFPTEWLYVD